MIQRNQSAAFSSGKVRPNHETNINIIARRTGKDVNSHTVLDGIITTIMATIQRINIIGSREGSRNRRRLKANQTGKKFRVGIKSNISTNRNNLDRKSGSAGMPRPISYAVFCLKKKSKKKEAGGLGSSGRGARPAMGRGVSRLRAAASNDRTSM